MMGDAAAALCVVFLLLIVTAAAFGISSRRRRTHDPRGEALVVFASTRGRSRELAQRVAHELRLKRRDVKVIDASSDQADPWDLLLNNEARDLVLLVSTAQGGLPPEKCRSVFSELEEHVSDFRVGATALSGHRFAILGLGSSAYIEFCIAAKKADKSLRKLGAIRVSAEFLDDTAADSGEAKFEVWLKRTVSALTQAKRRPPPPRRHRPKAVIVQPVAPTKTNDLEDLTGAAGQAMVTNRQAANLKKEGYKLIGSHSAVKMCRWTKHQLRGRGGCYKHTFYGITSYQCMEATPSLACANKCVFCIAHGTLINLADGIAIPIEQFTHLQTPSRVLALNESGDGLVPQAVTAFTESGTKPCIELLLQDGRTLVCTPDHRIRTLQGDWVQAGHLRPYDKLAVGVEFPQSSLALELGDSSWSLDMRPTLGLTLHIRTPEARAQTFVFVRTIGRLLTSPDLWFTHKLDLDAYLADLQLLTNEEPVVSACDRDLGFRVTLPRSLMSAIGCIGGVDCVWHVPSFLTTPSCPRTVIREFLGGLFGGHGSFVSRKRRKGACQMKYNNIHLNLTRKGSFVIEQRHHMTTQLLPLLSKCAHIDHEKVACVVRPLDAQQTEEYGETVEACTPQGAPVLTSGIINNTLTYSMIWKIGSHQVAKFAQYVGFRYSCDKQMRLSVKCSAHSLLYLAIIIDVSAGLSHYEPVPTSYLREAHVPFGPQGKYTQCREPPGCDSNSADATLRHPGRLPQGGQPDRHY